MCVAGHHRSTAAARAGPAHRSISAIFAHPNPRSGRGNGEQRNRASAGGQKNGASNPALDKVDQLISKLKYFNGRCWPQSLKDLDKADEQDANSALGMTTAALALENMFRMDEFQDLLHYDPDFGTKRELS